MVKLTKHWGLSLKVPNLVYIINYLCLVIKVTDLPKSSWSKLEVCKVCIESHDRCDQVYLQSDGETDEVNDHFLIGELNGQNGERGEEQFEVFMDVVFLFTAQEYVAVELLAVLENMKTLLALQANLTSVIS